MEKKPNKQENLLQLMETDWYKSRPEEIQAAIKEFAPGYYRLKNSGKQCFIIGYNESDSNHEDPKFHSVTFIVMKTGVGGLFPALDKSQHIHGVQKEDIEPWEDGDKG